MGYYVRNLKYGIIRFFICYHFISFSFVQKTVTFALFAEKQNFYISNVENLFFAAKISPESKYQIFSSKLFSLSQNRAQYLKVLTFTYLVWVPYNYKFYTSHALLFCNILSTPTSDFSAVVLLLTPYTHYRLSYICSFDRLYVLRVLINTYY